MRPVMLLAILAAIGGTATAAVGGPVPSPLQGVTVEGRVNFDSRSRQFTYDYLVTNPVQNDGKVWNINIDISRAPGEAVLSREGLISGPRYMEHTSDAAIQRTPVVPVGISGPPGWMVMIGSDDSTPPRGLATWAAQEDQELITPGRRLTGFRLVSPGLPGIRFTSVQPDIDYENLPQDLRADVAKQLALPDGLVFATSTVGPKAPPDPFVKMEFLNYLITLVHDSQRLGWVREPEVAKKLLKRLVSAKRRLENGEGPKAARRIEQFLTTVRHEGCTEFECRREKGLTSEAYALLFFNGRYLLERLPPPSGDEEDD